MDSLFVAATIGALGGLAGVLATWVDPDASLDDVPTQLRKWGWWLSSVAWVALGGIWSFVMNFDKVTTAVVAFQLGIVAPYAIQQIAAAGKRKAGSAGSVR